MGILLYWAGHLRGYVGSALDHRSLPPEFESWYGHIWKVVSSLTLLHYLWRSLSSFSLTCASSSVLITCLWVSLLVDFACSFMTYLSTYSITVDTVARRYVLNAHRTSRLFRWWATSMKCASATSVTRILVMKSKLFCFSVVMCCFWLHECALQSVNINCAFNIAVEHQWPHSMTPNSQLHLWVWTQQENSC